MRLEADRVVAGGSWFSSRRSQGFYLAAARPGRIEAGGSADQPLLTSTFEFPLERLFWLAADRKTWWQAGEVPQGKGVALSPCSEGDVRAALQDATGDAPPEFQGFLKIALERPGHFVALASKPAAIETHRGIRWQTHGIVAGRVVVP